MQCEICQHTLFHSHRVREMMFGLCDEFEYAECLGCGRLLLLNPPTDWSRYYPRSYYSFQHRVISPLKLVALYAHRFGISAPLFTLNLAKLMRLQGYERILDVGGGFGQVARELRIAGYNAVSIDPFIEEENEHAKRASLSQIQSKWDRIMFNHSLEHMANQLEVLGCVRERLACGGLCFIRIPIAEATWHRYGVHWVQLDAPRHLCVHTLRSFHLVAAKAGFRIIGRVGDSGPFQFWGSELYAAGVPLTIGEKDLHKHFSKSQMREFQALANELNKSCLGDAAAFLLAVSSPDAPAVKIQREP